MSTDPGSPRSEQKSKEEALAACTDQHSKLLKGYAYHMHVSVLCISAGIVNAVALLRCYKDHTAIFGQPCKEQHEAFWACYKNHRVSLCQCRTVSVHCEGVLGRDGLAIRCERLASTTCACCSIRAFVGLSCRAEPGSLLFTAGSLACSPSALDWSSLRLACEAAPQTASGRRQPHCWELHHARKFFRNLRTVDAATAAHHQDNRGGSHQGVVCQPPVPSFSEDGGAQQQRCPGSSRATRP